MSNSSAQNETVDSQRVSLRRGAWGRLCRLCLKELREILRDRRTLITLIVMPLIVYPLLALVFQRFLLTSLTDHGSTEFVYGFESEQAAGQVMGLVNRGDQLLDEDGSTSASSGQQTQRTGPASPGAQWLEIDRDDAESLVAAGALHVAVIVDEHSDKSAATAESDSIPAALRCVMIHRTGSPTSEAALTYLQRRLRALNDDVLRHELTDAGVVAPVPIHVDDRAVDHSDEPLFSLAALLPLILVLMTVTGAVYPAIDLTAGERERGTLETLIAAPVPRLGLLLAKYVAVLSVAVLTAVMNLIGMVITARSTGLDAVLLGEQGMSISVVLKVLSLLVLFAAFFSAVLLALTSYARSFKEAQAYIIPLMLVCLMPGIVCLLPGLESGGVLAVTPLVNIILLARDLLEGSANSALAAAAVVSTAFYVFGAIAIAARIFGTDAILYGGGWPWLSFADGGRREAVSPSLALACLALLFPSYFILSGLVAQVDYRSLEMKLVLCAAVTALLFAGLPLVIASLAGVNLSSGLQLRRPATVSMIAASLLGLTLWPVAYEIVQWQRTIGIDGLGMEHLATVKQLLEEIPQVSPWLLVATLAITPAVCEELFFRGFLLTALRSATSDWMAILVSSLLFGLFHVVTATVLSEWRFLPSTFLGLALGWVCVRTGSVIPGMFLHAIHNGLLVLVSHYRERLVDWGIGDLEKSHLPVTWITMSLIGIAVGLTMITMTTRWRPGRGRRF